MQPPNKHLYMDWCLYQEQFVECLNFNKVKDDNSGVTGPVKKLNLMS